MFNKKNCKRCGKKISKDYEFCPYCGNSESNQKDWGLLGRNDFFSPADSIKLPTGFNTLFNHLMKDLNKQFNSMDSEMVRGFDEQKKGAKKSGLSISISTFGNAPPKIKINKIGGREPSKEVKEKKKKFTGKKLSPEKIEKLSKLPKEEPLTEMKRFSDKIAYEINLPGVKSIDDVSIMNLENSIEIKAIAKDKVYTKIIPINLPIRNYKLAENKLVLELETE